MIKVYHFDHKSAGRDLSYDVFSGKVIPKFDKYNYHLVAIVDASNVDDAYYLTNHIDKDWTTNYHVTAVNGKHRSSSVGDIFVMDDGRAFICARIGWTELKEEEVANG